MNVSRGIEVGLVATWVVPGFAEERQLGSGASGRVVAAVHVASGTPVAIKYLLPRLLGDPMFLAGFRAEAELLKSLTDRNVVRLYDYIEAAGDVQGAAIIMEMIDGVSLFEMITRQGPTGPESALLVPARDCTAGRPPPCTRPCSRPSSGRWPAA